VVKPSGWMRGVDFFVFVDALDLSELCLKVLFLEMVSGDIRFNGSMPSGLSFLSFSPTLFRTLLLLPDQDSTKDCTQIPHITELASPLSWTSPLVDLHSSDRYGLAPQPCRPIKNLCFSSSFLSFSIRFAGLYLPVACTRVSQGAELLAFNPHVYTTFVDDFATLWMRYDLDGHLLILLRCIACGGGWL